MTIQSDLYDFSYDNINSAPITAGVYQLEDSGTIIYIGRALGNSTTIRSRLQDHKSGREGSCTQYATHYRREKTANGNDAARREVELLREYKARYGRLPRCNDRIG